MCKKWKTNSALTLPTRGACSSGRRDGVTREREVSAVCRDRTATTPSCPCEPNAAADERCGGPPKRSTRVGHQTDGSTRYPFCRPLSSRQDEVCWAGAVNTLARFRWTSRARVRPAAAVWPSRAGAYRATLWSAAVADDDRERSKVNKRKPTAQKTVPAECSTSGVASVMYAATDDDGSWRGESTRSGDGSGPRYNRATRDIMEWWQEKWVLCRVYDLKMFCILFFYHIQTTGRKNMV